MPWPWQMGPMYQPWLQFHLFPGKACPLGERWGFFSHKLPSEQRSLALKVCDKRKLGNRGGLCATDLLAIFKDVWAKELGCDITPAWWKREGEKRKNTWINETWHPSIFSRVEVEEAVLVINERHVCSWTLYGSKGLRCERWRKIEWKSQAMRGGGEGEERFVQIIPETSSREPSIPVTRFVSDCGGLGKVIANWFSWWECRVDISHFLALSSALNVPFQLTQSTMSITIRFGWGRIHSSFHSLRHSAPLSEPMTKQTIIVLSCLFSGTDLL